MGKIEPRCPITCREAETFRVVVIVGARLIRPGPNLSSVKLCCTSIAPIAQIASSARLRLCWRRRFRTRSRLR
jgi:hypothetical protein